MRRLAAKIVLLFVLLSFTGELSVNVISGNFTCYVFNNSDETSDKKGEENNTKEENKDKILTHLYNHPAVLIESENFHADCSIRTDTYKSLPEMPPDQS